jgi:hypothetical protein
MATSPPKTLTVANDDDVARYVGRTTDGRQFFLTTPFVPASDRAGIPGREFLALYTFDQTGQLVDTVIDDLGTRANLDEAACAARREALLRSLGPLRYCSIQIAPFAVRRFGVDFGFIPRPPEEEGDDYCVIVEPGDYMCFWPPWTSGEYDT